MSRCRRILGFLLILVFVFSFCCAPAFGAYNEIPNKNFPKLLEATLGSGNSPNVKVELMFSNNVAAIEETNHQNRPDMVGVNKKNEQQFSMHDSGGNAVDVEISRHPNAALHADESKYFYVSADNLDINETYTIEIDENLYGNMGNSLPCPYEVTFCIATGEIDFEALGKIPSDAPPQPLTFAKCNVATNEKDVAVDTVFEITFPIMFRVPKFLNSTASLLKCMKAKKAVRWFP